jgi:hypothetical protein
VDRGVAQRAGCSAFPKVELESTMTASGHFRLSISKALTDQLHEHLHELTPVALSPANLARLESSQGVYQLYLLDDLVYVGSASSSIKRRLEQHRNKLAGRQHISADEVAFTCLYVDEDLTVLAPEDRLIRVFQDEGSCVWNGNGFGLHDPGRRRDETEIPPSHFDALYPIRLDWACEIDRGQYELRVLLSRVKQELPFNFRYETTVRAKRDYAAVTVEVPRAGLPARALLALIAAALPSYQVTALPGYVIMYRERRSYPQGEVIQG